jgi:hypothetical protein
MTGIAVTSWAANGHDKIDLFWLDKDLQLAHVGSNGHEWSGNRIWLLGPVIPYWPDALGSICTIVPEVVTSLVRAQEPIEPIAPAPAHQSAAHPADVAVPAAGTAISASAGTGAGYAATDAAAAHASGRLAG